jgi:hypothetical protein
MAMNVSYLSQHTALASTVHLACRGTEPGSAAYFLTTLKVSPEGQVHRMIVVNGVIHRTAASLLQRALEQADEAALADAQIFAANMDAYSAEPGQRAHAALQAANERVEWLQQLADGSSDLGTRGSIDVFAWRELLNHFGLPHDTGAMTDQLMARL